MGNFGIAFKKFITNKNTVTVIGIIIILLLLYWGYDSTVKKSVNPVNVPVAKDRITSEHLITYDDIDYKKVSRVVLGDNVLTNAAAIVGMYTNINVTIPKGSMFYSEWLIKEEDVPGKWIEKVDFANGEEAYYFNTNNIKTLGNSVLPNSYIDIYMKALDENDTLMVGKLLENIQVLAVHDSNGHNVFSDSANIGSTSYLGFALSHDYYILLQKAERLSSLGIELILAPQGVTPQVTDDENTVFVGSETLRDYIDANTVMLDDEHIEVKPEVEENNNSTNQANSGVNNQGVNNGTTQNPTNQTNTTTQTNVR